MERFNPFASGCNEDPDPLMTNFQHSQSSRGSLGGANSSVITIAGGGGQEIPSNSPREIRTDSIGSGRYATIATSRPITMAANSSRYSTSFPDPFDGDTTQLSASAMSGGSEQVPAKLPPQVVRDPVASRTQAFPSSPSIATSASTAAAASRSGSGNSSGGGNRSNSVTFAPTHTSQSIDDPVTSIGGGGGFTNATTSSASTDSPHHSRRMVAGGRQASSSGGFTSFLSRATSVTSSSVTGRVSDAVGSVRSAVDSISSQIQQAVPSSNLISTSSSSSMAGIAPASSTTLASPSIQSSSGIGDAAATTNTVQQQQQQQQSAASYLASKISSATNQFVSSGQNSGPLPVQINRQRVVLILDNVSNTDWAQQFQNYKKLTSGLTPSAAASAQSALTSFFSSATAQLTSGSSSSTIASAADGADLIEQADFRDVSVLANQNTSTATIYVASNRSSTSSINQILSNTGGSSQQQQHHQHHQQQQQQRLSGKIIRPEYVVVKQRTKDKLDHLRGIVTALNYCLVPMFVPFEIWNIFQDRQLVFATLLRVQKQLGKENFPLIPQLYCQTHLDLLNYINSSSVTLPCLVRTSGPMGKGKIRIDNLQMLKDFASIVGTSGLSCTIEQFLNIKCDLVIQKLGTSLKLFKKDIQLSSSASGTSNEFSRNLANQQDQQQQQQQQQGRQSATRQTSIGSSVLSSLISSASGGSQQTIRRSSNTTSSAFEKMSEVNIRYKNWIETIMREFDNKIPAFCLKIVVTNNDREYIVGMADYSMDFMGNAENQDEDRRSFVELIISNMNTVLPKGGSNLSRETSNSLIGGGGSSIASSAVISQGSCDNNKIINAAAAATTVEHGKPLLAADKKKFTSQTQLINGATSGGFQHYQTRGGDGASSRAQKDSRTFGQLSSRSQSVSVNQSDYLDQSLNKSSYFAKRRGSDRSDSLTNETENSSSLLSSSGIYPQALHTAQQHGTTFSDSISSNSTTSLHQRQSSLGQSFLDQTSTAFSSFHKQSLSFFKRLDSLGGSGGDIISSTPPQSAKSDITGFDRGFGTKTSASATTAAAAGGIGVGVGHQASGSSSVRNAFKSQSIDCSTIGEQYGRHSLRRRETPPKPPPPNPQSRQSSLASYNSSHTHRSVSSVGGGTPNSTPAQSRQNSTQIVDSKSTASVSGNGDGNVGAGGQRGRVVRQNSALSAFEPFDPTLTSQLRSDQTCGDGPNLVPSTTATIAKTKSDRSLTFGGGGGSSSSSSATMSQHQHQQQHFTLNKPHKSLDSTRKGTNFDSASITSGDSNSTGETITAEDTMNNLKKTFASIFGDKCDE